MLIKRLPKPIDTIAYWASSSLFCAFVLCITARPTFNSDCIRWALPSQPERTTLSSQDIGAVLTKCFGGMFRLQDKARPNFVFGDFNGDGVSDLAVVVRLCADIAKTVDSKPEFAIYDPLPPEFDVQTFGKPRSLGDLAHWRNRDLIIVVHGGAGDWCDLGKQEATVLLAGHAGKGLLVSHFRGEMEPARAYSTQKKIGKPPFVNFDSILLDRAFSDDTGELIYWDGVRYRYYPIKQPGL